MCLRYYAYRGTRMHPVIYETIHYIEDHLNDTIKLDDVAEAVNYSLFYLQRLFMSVTGMGLREYIRKRQLTRAAFDVIESNRRIIDIALQYGFQTPESFTKAFRKQHLVAPSKVRGHHASFMVMESYLYTQNKKEQRMNVKIITLGETNFCGERHVFDLNNEIPTSKIPTLWEEFNRTQTDQWMAKHNDGAIQGIIGLCRQIDRDTMEYWLGTTCVAPLKNYEVLALASARYAVFTVTGALPDAIQKGWHDIMTKWIPTSGYEIDGSFDLEVYRDEDPLDENTVSEIWIKLK